MAVGGAGPRGAAVLAGLGVALLLAGVGHLVLVWVRFGVEEADRNASVLAAVLAAAGLAAGMAGWALNRRRVAALPATAEQLDQAAATLAGAVREQWVREARARALDGPEPMPVRWRLTPHLADRADPLFGLALHGWVFAFTLSGRCGTAPWRLMGLLDDCHRLGLLRSVGPVYQFRHAQLQDHLAPPVPAPASADRTPAR